MTHLKRRNATFAFLFTAAFAASCGGQSKQTAAPRASMSVEAMTQPPPSDDPADQIRHYSAQIDEMSRVAGLPTRGYGGSMSSDAGSTQSESESGDMGQDDVASEAVHPTAEERPTPSATNKVTSVDEAPTCTDICRLKDAICKNADRICEIAEELPGDAWAEEKCQSGKDSCEDAKDACTDCGGS